MKLLDYIETGLWIWLSHRQNRRMIEFSKRMSAEAEARCMAGSDRAVLSVVLGGPEASDTVN